MFEVLFPAFRPGGRLITLLDVLSQVRGEGWEWHVISFEGTSRRDASLDVIALERAAMATDEGLRLSWIELLELASAVEQVIDGGFAAFGGGSNSQPVLKIEALDSTEWRVLADHACTEAASAARAIERMATSHRH